MSTIFAAARTPPVIGRREFSAWLGFFLGVFLCLAPLVFPAAFTPPPSEADSAENPGDFDFYFAASPTPVLPLPVPTPVEVESTAPLRCSGAKIRYLDEGKVIVAEGGVELSYKDIEIKARKITVYVERKEAYAEGGVHFRRGEDYLETEALRYDFIKEEGMLAEGAGYFAPTYGRAGRVETRENRQASLYDGRLTTDDYADPDYYLEASEITVVFDRNVKIWNPVFYVSGVPIFYFPYYYRSLRDDCHGSFLYPGYRNTWGMYLLSGYNWCAEGLRLTGHLDYRYRRGAAVGLDGAFRVADTGEGNWQTYYLRDLAYENPNNGQTEHKDRYLAEMWYRQELAWDVQGDLSLHYLSDKDIRRNFFEKEYRADSQPISYLYFKKTLPDVSLTLEARPRLNEFYNLNEKLPEARAQVKEISIGESDFYYQGDNSLGYYRQMLEDQGSPDYESARGDTYHRLSYTRKIFGWLSVNPYTSLRGTYYSRAPGSVEAVPTPDVDPTPEPSPTPVDPDERSGVGRFVYGAGLGLSTNIYGIFDYRNEAWGIVKLRHVIEPMVNYVYQDTSENPDRLYQFDSIDTLSRASYFQLSLRNQLQTKRIRRGTENSWTLLDLIVGSYLFTSPDRDNGGNLFGDFYSDLKITPFPNVGMELESYYDMYDGAMDTLTLDAWLSGEDRNDWRLGLEYSYRREQARNRLAADVYFRVNPLWRFGMYGRYDLQGGIWEEESITVYRDLHSWDCNLTVRRKEEADEIAVFLSFYLKAFPDTPLHISN